ncbi:hypothetical protein Tco_0013075 [Tanacetum coccineum]
MACVAPGSHGGDAGVVPQTPTTRPVPPICQIRMLRLETGNASLRKAFRENNKQPLQLGFDYADLGTFHPLGNFASMLNSLKWGNSPATPPMLASDKMVVGSNVYTMGERVRLGLELKLRLLWRKNKNRIKADIIQNMIRPTRQRIIRRCRECGETEPKMSGMSWLTGGPIRIVLDMKAIHEMIKAIIIPSRNLDEVHSEFSGNKSKKRVSTRKQADERSTGLLASLKADAADQRANVAYQNTESIYGALAQRPHYTLLTNPHMNDSRSCDQLAQDLARENNNECSSREEEEEEEGEQQSGDDYSEEEE